MKLCPYFAKNAQRLLSVKKEALENACAVYVGTLDLYRSSKEIALIAFLFENNIDYDTARLFNQAIKKLKDHERDLMEEPRKSLKNVGFPLGKVIDLVGKLVKPEALEIFVGKMERSQAKSFLGLRDQKVMSVDLIKITLESDLEARTVTKSNRGGDDSKGGDIMVNTMTNNFTLKTGAPPMQEDTSSYFDGYDGMGSKYDGTTTNKDLVLTGDNFELGGGQTHHETNRQSTRKNPNEKLPKLAGRYIWGDGRDVRDIKRMQTRNDELRELLENDDQELGEELILNQQLELVEKKYKETLEEYQLFNSAYEDLLTTFNQQKSTYHVLGNELRILEKMGEFLEEFLEDKDPKQKKQIEHILNHTIPEAKKTKLVMGKCIEFASKEIYVDDEQMFKFALDSEDYENDKYGTYDTALYEYLRQPFTADAQGAIGAFKVIDDMERRALGPEDILGQGNAADEMEYGHEPTQYHRAEQDMDPIHELIKESLAEENRRKNLKQKIVDNIEFPTYQGQTDEKSGGGKLFSELSNGIAMAIYNKYKQMKVGDEIEKSRHQEESVPLRQGVKHTPVSSKAKRHASPKSRKKSKSRGASKGRKRSPGRNGSPGRKGSPGRFGGRGGSKDKKKPTHTSGTKKSVGGKKAATSGVKKHTAGKGDLDDDVVVRVSVSGGKGNVKME